MGLNLTKERESQLKLKSGGRSNTWKPQDGPNVIRVFPFEHRVTKEDVAEELYEKADLGKKLTEWCYRVTMHYGLNPKNPKAPVKSSPEIIELWKTLKNSKDEDDQNRADQIKPSNKFAMNIIDLNDMEKGVQIYMASKTVRTFIGDLLIDEDFGEAILGVKGRDVKIKFDSKAKDAKEFYKLMLQDKDKSRPMNSKITEGVKDLYSLEVNAAFVDVVDYDDLDIDSKPPVKEDLEGDSDESPKAVKRALNGAKSKAEKDDDLFDD